VELLKVLISVVNLGKMSEKPGQNERNLNPDAPAGAESPDGCPGLTKLVFNR
jgi:hypothetical protein